MVAILVLELMATDEFHELMATDEFQDILL